jgi:hypothetical protein
VPRGLVPELAGSNPGDERSPFIGAEVKLRTVRVLRIFHENFAGRKPPDGDAVAGCAPGTDSPADRSSIRSPFGTASCTSHCSTAALSVRSPAGKRWPTAPLEGCYCARSGCL